MMVTEVVAQLAVSAEKLAQAADRLAHATARPSASVGPQHERIETARSPADAITQQMPEAADATDGE